MNTPAPSRFFYISDVKLGRLWEQFPPPWWRRLLNQITSLTIFMVSVGKSRSETTRMQKLRWVQRRLEELGKIGGIDEPQEYFFGRLTMHYDAFDMVSPPTVYLVGETDKTIVALGGSLKHVPGREDVKPREGAQQILSEVQFARAVRRAQLMGSPRLVSPAQLHDPAQFDGNPLLANDSKYNARPRDDQWAVDIAETLWRWPIGVPPITFETLAEREELTPTPAEIASRTHKNILVGSPVYVTRA
jgi:hypothetical protein